MLKWDILNENKHEGYPYTNINKILKKHDKLIIKFLNNNIEFKFKKYNDDGLKKYVELTSIGYDEETGIYNLKMRFYSKNKRIYIASISRSANLSGKTFVKLAEMIAKKMGATYIYLSDGTSTMCDSNNYEQFNKIDLSLYLLFKNKRTYYQKLGFKLNINSKINNMPQLPDKTAEKTLKYFLKKVNKLKLEVINKNNKQVLNEIRTSIINNYKIKIRSISWKQQFNNIDVENNFSLYNDFLIYSNIYNFLPKTGNFVEEMLKLYNKHCNIYNYIISVIKNYITYNEDEFGFSYEFPESKYNLEEVYSLLMLITYRDNVNWNGYFIKKI